ncbi:MAG TPA: glycoside hydrolase family 57 [Bacillota bacterium]|mgnify:FL=1|nr:glycoside hydrolase family 57 [Bacillota bacterium]
MNGKLLLYSIFHLNLAFSSVEESQRAEIVKRCYWPLLRLAGEYRLPFGIELPAYTLEAIYNIDPSWVEELRRLVTEGPCEFIGSGYAQLIGPLVPAEVNAANLRIGNAVYLRLLGIRPGIALINEQAYSAGLIRHYLEAGYRAIIMEWDNPASYHPEWDRQWRYLPQVACNQHGDGIPLIWSKSIAFQKFQRYAHGEMELDEYMDYLAGHLAAAPRAFPLYANDVEIFDFRPGRYHTEPPIENSEWERIRLLFERLLDDGRFQFVSPGQLLELLNEPGGGNRLHLESPEQPVPVKKQGKYNVTRWAVTGRDDLYINTACWRIYERLKEDPLASEDDWRELCYLWSSDFRTHITEARWRGYRNRLEAFERRTGSMKGRETERKPEILPGRSSKAPVIERQGRYLIIETETARVRLNCRRGLAIDGLWLGSLPGPPLCATLPHGYYDDISLGSDWYTGHVVLETVGRPKITDLNHVEPVVEVLGSGDVVVEGAVPTPLGAVTKRVDISATLPVLSLNFLFDWETVPMGSFRLGNITLNPEAFDSNTLYYRTRNGGREDETFLLSGRSVDHGTAVSFLVSARCGLGVTSGWVEMGDARKSVRVEIDKTSAALIGLMSYREIGESFYCRLAFSAGEMDETRRISESNAFKMECRLRISGGA